MRYSAARLIGRAKTNAAPTDRPHAKDATGPSNGRTDALQRRASYRTRKGRCSTLIFCILKSATI